MALPIKTGQLMIILALIMAVISGVLLQNISGKNKNQQTLPSAKAIRTESILVAARGIPAGSVLTSEDLKSVEWPRDMFHPQSIYRDEQQDFIIGKPVKSDILPGEPIFRQKVITDAKQGGLPIVIPNGMRAVTIGVTEIKGVAGFVKAGDRVDVIANYQVSSGGSNSDKETITRTIVQNALVLAVAQEMVDTQVIGAPVPRGVSDSVVGIGEDNAKDNKNGKDNKNAPKKDDKKEQTPVTASEDNTKGKVVSSITLAVLPTEAQALTFADENGQLRLSLRSPSDMEMADLPATSSNSLHSGGGGMGSMFSGLGTLSVPSGLPAVPPPPTTVSGPKLGGRSVEFINGTEKQDLSF